MRINLPITQRNYAYPAHQTLISITDLKGRITYCNKDFIDVSGYTQTELMGQPHNLLRHPDMPEEAFRDFWTTIQSGKLWSAIIKNRRKNGDTYWVRANATPMRNGDKVVGYLSVRTLPGDVEIKKADKLFAEMREQAQHGRLRYVFKEGLPRRAGWLGKLTGIFRPGRHAKIAWLLLLAIAGPSLAVAADGPLWLAGLVALLSVTVAWVGLVRALIQPQNRAADIAKQLAGGDLSEFVQIADAGTVRELLLPVSQLALATRTVMADVRYDLQALSGKSVEIASRSAGLEKRTQAQAESLVRTASAMEEISGTIEQTSHTTKLGVQTAHDASQAVGRSQEVVQSVAVMMQEIADSASNISEFVQVIEGVAFQTNILALNASVEAARAGEFGRGFAVVASEVRALSHRTTTAAKEIKDLIDESQQRVSQGNARVQEARSQMEEVVAMVGRVKQMLEEINLASSEQAAGTREVSDALRHLDQITQQNSEMVLTLSELCGDMSDSTKTAQNNLRVFRLTDKDLTHAEVDAVELRKQSRQLSTDNHPQAVALSHGGQEDYLLQSAQRMVLA